MRFSRYPRYNQPIAPRALSDILEVNVPRYLVGEKIAQGTRLCDLDVSVWQRYEPDVCKQLAHAVVHQVRSAIHSLPRRILDQRVHHLPKDVGFDALELDWRTYNLLTEKGLLKSPKKLGNQTVGSLLAIPGFGAKSLVDLLTSLEALLHEMVSWSTVIERSISEPISENCPKSELDHRITAKAKQLQRMPNIGTIYHNDPRLGRLFIEIDIAAKTVADLSNRLLSRRYDPLRPDKILKKLEQLGTLLNSLA